MRRIDRNPASGAEGPAEGLERQVAELSAALSEAREALRRSEEEAAARDRARREAEAEAARLGREAADERLRLHEQYTARLAALRRELEERRRAELEANAGPGPGFLTAISKNRKRRQKAERRRQAEIEALRDAADRWEKELRGLYRTFEDWYAAEVEVVESEARGRERALRSRLMKSIEGERRQESPEQDLETFRNVAAGRELDLQREHRAELEDRHQEMESLKRELHEAREGSDALRKAEVREVKVLAERRERELRQAHATRLQRLKEGLEHRLSNLQAQRTADHEAYRSSLESLEREVARERHAADERVRRLAEGHARDRAALEGGLAELEEPPGEGPARRGGVLGSLRSFRPRLTGPRRMLEASREPVQEPPQQGDRGSVPDAGRQEKSDGDDLLESSVALFNESKHPRAVVSISKVLGLPEAWVGPDGASTERVSIVLVWGELSWRRHVCKLARGSGGREVYVSGAGEDPEEIRREGWTPNARVDSGGQLYLGLRPD
ncbi:MAG: hypothetical protein H0V53_14315 [Rubrobacter sp.]|nr:hypothetical protein [Rubrobacter sp.]